MLGGETDAGPVPEQTYVVGLAVGDHVEVQESGHQIGQVWGA